MDSINNAKLTHHSVGWPLFATGLFDSNTLVKTLKDKGRVVAEEY